MDLKEPGSECGEQKYGSQMYPSRQGGIGPPVLAERAQFFRALDLDLLTTLRLTPS